MLINLNATSEPADLSHLSDDELTARVIEAGAVYQPDREAEAEQVRRRHARGAVDQARRDLEVFERMVRAAKAAADADPSDQRKAADLKAARLLVAMTLTRVANLQAAAAA